MIRLENIPADVGAVAAKLGKAQRRVILSLSDHWGEASCHRTAKRMFYGVGTEGHTVVQHKHMTDNCWRLSKLGLAVKEALLLGGPKK